MRGRVIAAFVVGFAIGALCIGVGMWSTGRVQTTHLPPWVQRVPAAPPAPAVPDLNAGAKLPSPPVPPPEGAPAATEGSADRAADRAVTEAPGTSPATTAATVAATAGQTNPPLHLAAPIAGLDPKTLNDTFYDARTGHMHEALDIPAPRGTPVLAVAEGNVAKLFTSKEGGLTVYQFDNSKQYAFYYAHLDHYAPGLKEGMLLRKGDTLGYVGTTGNAPPNAPHLHFAVFKLGPEKHWWQGAAIDPLPILK